MTYLDVQRITIVEEGASFSHPGDGLRTLYVFRGQVAALTIVPDES